jgi:hypothetical protein
MTSGRLAAGTAAKTAFPCLEPEDLVLHVYRRWRETAPPALRTPTPDVLALITRLCRDRLLELERAHAQEH